MASKDRPQTLLELASKGGTARAEVLSAEERSAIAKKAAEERWAVAKRLPKETHAGTLKLGAGIPCSVLDNGMRVFSVNGLSRAFGSGAKGRAALEDGAPVPAFLSATNVRPFISDNLLDQLANPVAYRAMTGGRPALGYEANILRKMCDTLLDARAAGVLRSTQLATAHAAEALVRAFADVGIIALVDEATGYQYDRASDELRRLVEAYVVEDMRPWAKLFPDAFFRQVYRIHGWQYKTGVTQGPRYVGKFINKYVYSRLPPRVLERLRELSPVINKRRKHHLHRFLTEDIGEPTVDRHLASVTTLMTVAADKRHFDDMFKVAFPKQGDQLLLGRVAHPPAASHDGDDDVAELVSEPATVHDHVGGVALEAAPGVREKILAFMRSGNAVSTHDLAMVAYGNDDKGALGYTRNKLRKVLARLKAEGLIETPSPGIWRTIRGSQA
jgi:hypothetical protein